MKNMNKLELIAVPSTDVSPKEKTAFSQITGSGHMAGVSCIASTPILLEQDSAET